MAIDNDDVRLPFDLIHAVSRIRNDYGDSIGIIDKSKALLKFGRNIAVGTSLETVWEIGGDEAYVTTNAIDKISSSDTGDTTQTIRIEGHTVSGTGADAQYTFVVQTAILNGQNKVTLTTPLARVSRVNNASATALAGDVWVYEDTALTSGVPTDTTKGHIKILGTGGDNQSFKAATTFSNGDYYLLTQLYASVAKKTAADADIILEIREPGGLFLPKIEISAADTSGVSLINLNPVVIVKKNADVRLRCSASTTSVEVDAGFNGYITQVNT